MAGKSPLQKLQDAVLGTVSEAVRHPLGTAEKAVGQAKDTVAFGRMVAGQLTRTAAKRVAGAAGGATPVAPQQRTRPEPETAPEAPVEDQVEVTPADVARVVEKKAPAEKATRAPARKAPARKSTPSGQLPAKTAAKKTAAKKAPAKKAAAKQAATKQAATKQAATKQAASKTSAEKATAKKTPAKTARKTPAPRKGLSAAEVLEDTATETPTPVGTTAADIAHNPDTADTDLQQPGTEPLMDPATTKAVSKAARTGARAADRDKG